MSDMSPSTAYRINKQKLGHLPDRSWVRQSFMLLDLGNDRNLQQARLKNKLLYNFTDTTIGGNWAINSHYQFTSNADIKHPHLSPSKGMGRYYLEAIQENGVFLNMRMGHAMYNSLTGFFTNIYNPETSRMSRSGRMTPTWGEWFGNLTGAALMFPLQPFAFAGHVINFLLEQNQTKFYYVKPSMYPYYVRVSTIFNSIASAMGLVHNFDPTERNPTAGVTKSDIESYHKLLPDIFPHSDQGGIDIFAVINRAQRLSNAQREVYIRLSERTSNIDEFINSWDNPLVQTSSMTYSTPTSISDMWSIYTKSEQHKMSRGDEIAFGGSGNSDLNSNPGSANQTDAAQAESATLEAVKQNPDESTLSYLSDMMSGEMSGIWQYFKAEFREGSQFITFKVDNPGSITESFSSTAKESQLASTLNSMSAGKRDLRFNFANGNLGDGAIASTIESVAGFAADFASGVANNLGLSGMAILFGQSFVDIPKHYDSSSADMPKASYTIKLRTPYGNKLSQLMDLYLPLSFLLAAALPLSTGYQSYTSPYLIQHWCKGRSQSRMSLIDNLTVTRGVGDSGWGDDERPLGIDINLSFTDLSSVMHAPITTPFDPLSVSKWLSWGNTIGKNFLADDSVFNDYIGTLASISTINQTAPFRKLRRSWYNTWAQFDSWTSSARFAAWSVEKTPLSLMRIINPPSDLGM